MPKRKVPTAPKGFVVQADLVAFAVEHGYRESVATRLWNLLAGTIAPDLKSPECGVTLNIRCLASPRKVWPSGKLEKLTPTEIKHGWTISVKSLLEAQPCLYPHFSKQYGVALDRLFQEWAASLK